MNPGRETSEEDNHPLPKANYDTLKDKQIKDMLVGQELSNAGDRSVLIARHQRYIFNASLLQLVFTSRAIT